MGHLEPAREIRGLHGRYAVVSRLSRGDRRAVHLGRDERGRSVVLTELHASDIVDWGDVERTVAEGKLLGDLAHERIPRFVECFATDGERAMPAARFTETFVELEGPPEEGARLPSLVLVRAFVEGESIEEAIARRRRFASADLVRVARSLFEIVAFLHELHPPIALGELARSSVVIDAAGAAHPVDVGVALRNGATAAGPSDGDRARDVARAADMVVALAGGEAASSSLPKELAAAVAVARARAKDSSPNPAREVLAALDAPDRPARRGLPRSLRIAGIAAASLVIHVAGIAGAYAMGRHRPGSLRSEIGETQRFGSKDVVVPPPIVVPAPTPDPVLEWAGRLRTPVGKLAAGTPCLLTADVEPAPDDRPMCSVRLACGGQWIIDAGVADDCRIVETDGDAYRDEIVATRDGDTVKYAIDRSVATAFDERGAPRAIVDLDPKSLPRRGVPIGATRHFDDAVHYDAIVVESTQAPGVALGSKCSFDLSPLDRVDKNCSVKVACGGGVVYEHAGDCALVGVEPAGFTDAQATPIDGDPSLSWTGREVFVGDLRPGGALSIGLYLDRAPPVRDAE